MPDLGTATQNFIQAQKDLNDQAEKYAVAKRKHEEADKKLKREWAHWQKDPSETNATDLADAQTAANTAGQDEDQEANKFKTALDTFSQAYAEYMQAIYQLMF